MKLYASATSPFARKVRIALIELGLAEQVELVPTNPLESDDFRAVNPLAKIPALVLDDGSVLYDSGVIVDYLNTLDGRNKLIPADGFARVGELRRHALGDGILDAAVSIAFESRRPAEQQSATWIARWKEAITTGAAALAADLAPGDFGLAGITAAAVADYVAFRFPDLDISPLAAWRLHLGGRNSLERTHPARELVAA
ncbi:glutathione S-transferase N-terminal domain-containing protein [Novosphingobium sp.]|uniref:glutathione S-transferase N-terminal domain-containing protein n=1 Tax=Novosphingobium sp. TaxID=1874826 RepID=UPI0038BC82AF